jgi:RimJ/RimL family protein N-acetyltransferase
MLAPVIGCAASDRPSGTCGKVPRMERGWDWVEPIRNKHFGEPLQGKYSLERISEAGAYWDLHDREMRRHFPPEIFFDLSGMRGEEGRKARERLSNSMGENKLFDFWVARDGDSVAMMFSGHQVDDRIYRMWHSHVHPAYRRKGLYGEYVRRIIDYTKDLGFEAISSEHAPSNNAVLIAKLKAGFRIFSFEVDPTVGLSVCLRYFHDSAHIAAYEFRCGLATLDDRLLRYGRGAMPVLVQQIKSWAKE